MKHELGSCDVSEFGLSKRFYRQLKAICIANELVELMIDVFRLHGCPN